MIKELIPLGADEIQARRKDTNLLILDESAIACARLPELKGLIGGLVGDVVLMMHEDQYVRGKRGWAKAQILHSVANFSGLLSQNSDGIAQEVGRDWKSVSIPQPLVLESRRVVLQPDMVSVPFPEFPTTQNSEDQAWMQLARGIVSDSNCWYDPAGCVYVKKGQPPVVARATTYNRSDCAHSIPLNFRELPLNPGERMSFCDSQHAEREGIARAARLGISLDGATAFISKFPCRACIESMIGAGISRVVFEKPSYGLADAQLLLENGIEVFRI